MGPLTRHRRSAALASIAFAIGGLALVVVATVERFPRGLIVVGCVGVGLWAGWVAVRREAIVRMLAAATVAAAVTAASLLVLLEGRFGLDLLAVGALVLAAATARLALRAPVELPRAPRPRRPVLFFNPVSGGGKARRFHLDEEARSRGIEPIELRRGDDLAELVGQAIDGGADALAMAGGDGSQAIVAGLAAEHDLPYACIPAGTRNHFALDLGVDRDDVVGGLDAFVDGGERRVDLGEVNGRVFVNNVSLGFYADAVQRDGYREAKLRTLLEVAPEKLGSGSDSRIRWDGPDGDHSGDGVAVLISNDPYRLGAVIGSGTRPRLDSGVLGIATISSVDSGHGLVPIGFRLRQWSRPTFTVTADGPVAAGVDGEAVALSPPIQFVSRNRVLRVRISRGQPGASPSARVPRGLWRLVLKVGRIAVGNGRGAEQLRRQNERGEFRWPASRSSDARP